MWLATASLLAAAEPAPEWWLERQVAGVSVEVTSGALPDGDLQPLLAAAQGTPLTPARMRADVVTLYRVGGFSAVQAHVAPWIEGAEGPTVWVTYRVAPAPVLERISIQGARLRGPLRERSLLDAAGLAEEQVFHASVDGPRVEHEVETWLAERGYPRATVSLRSTEPEPGVVHAVLVVEPGEPDVVSRIAFAGSFTEAGLTEAQLRRWVRGAKLVEGRPLGPDTVRDARERIRERLGALRGSPLRPARGYVDARVSPVVVPDEDGIHVTFSVEPRSKLELAITGMGLRGRGDVIDALSMDHRTRLTGGFVDDAPRRLVQWLQERGRYRAEVSVRLSEAGATRVFHVDASRGGVHTLGAPLAVIDVEVDYRPPLEPEEASRLTRDVMAVLDQASPDVIRREFYTDDAIETAARATERFLAGRGHLDARVAVEPPRIRPRRTMANLFRRLAGAPPSARLDPRLAVSLGPVTRTSRVEVSGTVVSVPWLAEAVDEMTGAPYSPQNAETLAREIVDAHRAEGHLDADASVAHRPDGDLRRASTIVVTPGPRVLLRTVVVRNRRLTRRDLVLRTANLELSTPIRPIATPHAEAEASRSPPRTLDEVRSDLVGLGVFRAVSLDVLGDGPSRDLVISVDERPRTAIEIGGGVSTDQGLRAFVRLQRGNLFGSAHQLQAVAQLGLDYASDNARNWLLDVGNPEGRAAISYTAPRFLGAQNRLTMDVTFRERRQERTLRIDRSGFGATFQRSIGPSVLTTGLRIEARQLNQFDPPAVLQGEPWFGLIDADTAAPSRWRSQEAVTALWLYDRRDDPIRPTRGFVLSVSGEAAPGIPWSELRTSFIKAEARSTALLPLGSLTLRLVAGGGYIRSLSGGVAPVEDRFRLGGTGSLRGFVRDGVGPHARAKRLPANWPGGLGPWIDFSTRNDPDRWVPTGGDAIANGTAELIVPLTALLGSGWEGYAATAFLDVGNVWFVDPMVQLDGADTLDLPMLRYAAGIGARVTRPSGRYSSTWG